MNVIVLRLQRCFLQPILLFLGNNQSHKNKAACSRYRLVKQVLYCMLILGLWHQTFGWILALCCSTAFVSSCSEADSRALFCFQSQCFKRCNAISRSSVCERHNAKKKIFKGTVSAVLSILTARNQTKKNDEFELNVCTLSSFYLSFGF